MDKELREWLDSEPTERQCYAQIELMSIDIDYYKRILAVMGGMIIFLSSVIIGIAMLHMI